MGNIQQRPTKDGRQRYTARVRLQGHPLVTATFGRLTDARRWVARTESAILDGRHSPTATDRRTTVGDLLDAYEAQHVATRSDSFRRQREGHLRWWRHQLEGVRLLDLNRRVLSDALERLRAGDSASGKIPSAATRNRYAASFRHVCSWGVQREWLAANPFAKLPAAREPRGRVRFLDDGERERLLAACRASTDRRLLPLVVLALATGARQGELLGLRWRDVDLAANLATFHETKNNERRSVPLSPPAVDTLHEFGAVRRLDSDLIFASPAAKMAACATFPRKPWLAALTEAEISDFRFHDLRHTAASYFAMSGATLAELAEILGHKTLAMVRRYAHLSQTHLSGIADRMAEKFLS